MPAAPKHRQAIVNSCVTLFRRKGYSATGLNDIVEASGAPKGSLYHYFPDGKSSIAVAAVEEAGRRVAETVRKLSAECATAGDLVKAHARLIAGWMKQSGFRDGCPITTVLLELAPADRAVTEAGRKAYAARTDVMKQKLVADGIPERRADRLAILCSATLQGALIQSRVERSGTPIVTAADELADLLASA
ncbi:MAG: TetR/AcrR family transcriptional regulator [Hyphomonadaceae bacterium]|nr:TetR/AcrR family transcriptional regulator [Hyphomonadaceae bacterium]